MFTLSARWLTMALVLLSWFFPMIGSAHNLWLNATDFNPHFSPKTGAHTKVYFGFGHKFPVHDFLDKEKLVQFALFRQGNEVRPLEPGESGFLATPLVLKKAGAYVVGAATREGFYTLYRENGHIHHRLASKEGLEKVVLSLYFKNYTKALINVGETTQDAYATPVEHELEIIPLENPYLKKPGDTLSLKVVQNGEPVPYCNIFATYVGFSTRDEYAFANKTNGRGISNIRLLKSGHWIVKAVVRKPARKEWMDKCNEEKYTATLSFEVP